MKKNIENYYLTFENLTDTELVNGGYYGCEGTADVSLFEKKTNKLLIKERKNIRFRGTIDETIYDQYFDNDEETIEEQFGAEYAHTDDEEDEEKYDEVEQNRWKYVEEHTDEWFEYYFDEMFQHYGDEEDFTKDELPDYDDIIEEMVEDYIEYGDNEDFDYVVDSSTFVKGNRKLHLAFKYSYDWVEYDNYRKFLQDQEYENAKPSFYAMVAGDEDWECWEPLTGLEDLTEPLTIQQINDFVVKIKKEEFIDKGWKEVKAA